MRQSVWVLSVFVLGLGCGGSQTAPDIPASGVEGASKIPASPPTTLATTAPPSATAGAASEAELPMPCRQKARDVEGTENTSRLVRCPQDCTKEAGTVWGTDLYTDDSAVCPALVHAGVLPVTGGVAKITFVHGLRAYMASEQNGIKSNSYGKWPRSFYGQAVGSAGQTSKPAPQLPGENVARVDCSHRGSLASSGTGTTLTIICPAGCAERSYAVWGSNPYTSDSQVCAAAIHAGVIPPGGGAAVVTTTDGQPSYAGSSKNGIETRKYGKYGASFTVSAERQ